MPWDEFFQALESEDPSNLDRHNPGGDRIRVRINGERGRVVDFAVIYETPSLEEVGVHHEVVRYDGSHGYAHVHVFDRAGTEVRRQRLPTALDYKAAVTFAIAEIKRNWKAWRADFFGDET